MEDKNLVEIPVPSTDEIPSNKQILKGVKIPFMPIDDRILVKPLPVDKITKEIAELDEEANEGKEMGEDGDEMVMKTVTKEVDANVRKGVVLRVGKVGNSPAPFEEGDIIVFDSNAGVPFELYKNSILLKRFQVLGIWED